jgi:hypothetical protein
MIINKFHKVSSSKKPASESCNGSNKNFICWSRFFFLKTQLNWLDKKHQRIRVVFPCNSIDLKRSKEALSLETFDK